MSRNWKDSNDFDGLDRFRPSPNGRRHSRREKRHESKNHLRDIKDMVNNGEEVDEIMENLEEE